MFSHIFLLQRMLSQLPLSRQQPLSSCMQASALRSGACMACGACTSLLVLLAYLLGLVVGLAWRGLQVTVGTYQSAEWKVRRAGAVADLNAAVLAAAVILLLTSKQAFSDAQESTSRQAWLSQLSEKPMVACNTFNLKPFDGYISQGPSVRCKLPWGADNGNNENARYAGISLRDNVQQVLSILGIYSGCNAFSMAFRVQKMGNSTQLIRHTGSASIADALQKVEEQLLRSSSDTREALSLPVDPKDGSYNFDEIMPVDACGSPSRDGSRDKGPDTVMHGADSCVDLPEGFPPNTRVVRYLTGNNNVGLFLSYKCSWNDSDTCFSSSSAWSNFSIHGNGVTRGEQAGAFCPLSGSLGLTWGSKEPYHCAEGFDISQSFTAQQAKVNGLRLIHRFSYFSPCVSYEELFGIYIALAGVFVTVCLGTSVLLFTDIICPMLKCGSESWRASLLPLLGLHGRAAEVSPGSPGDSVTSCFYKGDAGGAAKQGFRAWQGNLCCKDLVDIVLRCTVSLALGVAVSVIFVLTPWLSLKEGKGPCIHPEPQKLYNAVFNCSS